MASMWTLARSRPQVNGEFTEIGQFGLGHLDLEPEQIAVLVEDGHHSSGFWVAPM